MNVIAEWEIVEAGYKFHMNDVAATVRLSYLANIIASARRNAKAYREAFAEIGHRIYSTTQPSRSEDRYLELYVALLGGIPPRVDERSPARDDFPIAPAVPCDAFRMGG
jgi:dTDP-4-amino-4,6-dideoxygalactose transaminase